MAWETDEAKERIERAEYARRVRGQRRAAKRNAERVWIVEAWHHDCAESCDHLDCQRRRGRVQPGGKWERARYQTGAEPLHYSTETQPTAAYLRLDHLRHEVRLIAPALVAELSPTAHPYRARNLRTGRVVALTLG